MQAGRVLAAHSRAGRDLQLVDAVLGPKVVLDVELQPILTVVGSGIGIGTGIGIAMGRPIVVPVGTGVGTVTTSATRCSRWRIVAPSSGSRRHLTLAEALRMVAASSHFCGFWQISKKKVGVVWTREVGGKSCGGVPTGSEEGTSASLSSFTSQHEGDSQRDTHLPMVLR